MYFYSVLGKSALPFSGYKYLANKALLREPDFALGIFADVLLLLCWNLIARCISVSSLMFQHISWSNDSMVIVFPTTKSDLEGKHCSPKHVYASPTCPAICPIMSFVVYFYTLEMRREGSKCSVFGDNVKGVEDRFGSWLGTVASVASVSAVLVQMGISRVEIGTHSFRKGVATFLNSMVAEPTAISIYLRVRESHVHYPRFQQAYR